MRFKKTTCPAQSCKSEGVELRIVRSLREVEALRAAWMAWPGSRDADIDFYLMIVQSYPEVVRPHVIVLYRNCKPDAILVGRLERKRLSFGVGYVRAFRPWARCLTFVYGSMHGNGSPENTRLLLGEVMDCLKQDEADVAMLEFVPLDSPLYHLSLQVPGILSRDTLPAPQGHSKMTVPESIEHVYGRMSRERRKHIKASLKRLQTNAVGEPEVVCYRTTADLDLLFQDAEQIARKTYQRGLGVGFADNPQVRKRLALGAEKGWLRGYFLYLGKRPCAFWIGMAYGETFVSEYMGYDPEFRQLSPGMVLIMRVIEAFCNHANGERVKQLDFGLGAAEYKEVLSDESWQEAVVYMFSPTLKGFSLKAMRTVARVVDRSARKALTSMKLFHRLKRTWRDRLAKRRLEPCIVSSTAGAGSRRGRV